MRHTRHAALFVSSLSFMVLSGCAGNVDEKDIHAIGHAEIVYVLPPANLEAGEVGGVPSTVPGATPSAAQGALTGALYSYANDKEASSIQARTSDIAALKFNDRLQSEFALVIAATPWLSNTAVKSISAVDVGDENEYTRKSSADSVIYLKPLFYMSPGNQYFIVDVFVEIQKADNTSSRAVHTIAKQEFTFRHHLSLVKPGMSWDQQKNLAHEVAAMNDDQAINAWLNDNAAMLEAAVSQDIPLIDQGLRLFFGDAPKTPSG